MGSILPNPVFTGLDNDGNPVVGGKLYTYAAGTTTPQDTYTSSTLGTANANPVILDSAGRAIVWLSDTNPYKFVLKTAADVTLWTSDNISSYQAGAAANLEVLGTAGEGIAKGEWCYLSNGDSGTAGLWYLTNGDNVAKSSNARVLAVAVANIPVNTAGRFRIYGSWTEGSGYTAGNELLLSSTPGAISNTSYTYPILVGIAYNSTSYVITTHDDENGRRTWASSVVEYGFAGEDLLLGSWVYLSKGAGGLTPGRWYKTSSANAYSSTAAVRIGKATAPASAGADFTVQTAGQSYKNAITAGAIQYLSTNGTITETKPATNARVAALNDDTTYAFGITGQPPRMSPHTNTTAVGNVGGGTDDLITFAVGGYTLLTDGQGIKITAWGTTAANANNKTITLNYGGTTLVTSGAVAFNNANWYIEATIIRTGATAQVAVARFSAATTEVITHSTPAETLTGDVTVKCTGTSAASATDDIIQKALVVEFLI